MKSPISIVHRISIGLQIVALAGCGAVSSANLADSRAVLESVPTTVQPSSVTLTGQLVLFGAEIDAWLGVRDASGNVTRLVFKSSDELASQRLLQNKEVIVKGSPLPSYLGRPQVKVVSLHVRP